MEAMGQNLKRLCATQHQGPIQYLSSTSVYKVIIQLIDRIRVIHSLGFVHNDIKLDNILIGHTDSSLIHLIDFGLSVSYLQEDGRTHVEKYNEEKFSGNILFASLNSCRGNNKSRRDDMESIIYVMLYLLNHNYLPWNDLHEQYTNQKYDFQDLLSERLELRYTK